MPAGAPAALVMMMPLSLTVVAPVVTLPLAPRSRFLFKAKSIVFPDLVTVRLVSPFAVPISTVSPALIAAPLAPLLFRVKPP